MLLTKTRFKQALECPVKLNYAGNPLFIDIRRNDPFLTGLAESGDQVGALAQCTYPGGIEVTQTDPEEAVEATRRLLQQESVVLFEPAIRCGSLLVRIDILVKEGNRVQLIEVKAKGCNGGDPKQLVNRDGAIKPRWRPYLLDVAFQRFVVRSAFPEWQLTTALMLTDREAPSTVDGLAGHFRVVRKGDQCRIQLQGDCSPSALGEPVLKEFQVDELCDRLELEEFELEGERLPLSDYILKLEQRYCSGDPLSAPVGARCRHCEFTPDDAVLRDGHKSGFKTCWMAQKGLKESDFKKPFVWDLWHFNDAQKLLDEGIFLMEDMDSGRHLRRGKLAWRQKMQLEKLAEGDSSIYINLPGLKRERDSWKWPLHLIDFETSMPVIPFFKGAHPYQQTAFQFSHHRLESDGSCSHAGQFISLEKGSFPSFDFVRELKRQLEGDEGTIFRYSDHENTVLKQISVQLSQSDERDRDELIGWIASITDNGSRTMVDLCRLVRDYYYNPLTGGSNSIKALFPAVLNSSEALGTIYGKPAYGYGKGCSINSLNFKQIQWVVKSDEGVADPYSRLEAVPMGEGELSIDNGAAALQAWNRVQSGIADRAGIAAVREALLRYCELDTLAMVMILQHWLIDFGLLSNP